MKKSIETLDGGGIDNLELVQWVEEKDSMRGARAVLFEADYKTFEEVHAAILKNGPIIAKTNKVDVCFFVLGGRFEDEIMVVRQSGLNVRRFLVRECWFESAFGNFQGCIDHHMSNNAVDCEIEVAHIFDYAERLKISGNQIDLNREHTRDEIDLIAALQLLAIRDENFNEDGDQVFLFSLGYSVGRLFSSIQNLVTLEEKAQQGFTSEENYRAKGKKSGSDSRKIERLKAFIDQIEAVYEDNPSIRKYEEMVLRTAFDIAIPKGSYGHGRYANYCTEIRSYEPYKARFNRLFRQVT